MVFESIMQAFKYIVECFRMVAQEPKLLLPSLASVVVGSFVGIFVIIASLLFGLFSNGLSSIFFLMFIVALIVSFGVNYLFAATTSVAIYEHVKFGKASLKKAFGQALAHWPTILGIAIIAAIVSMVVGSLRSNRNNRGLFGVIVGLLASFLAVALEEGWRIASMLLIPSAVIGGLGLVDAFKRSFEIAKNNLVLIGAGEVGIRLLTNLFNFVGFILAIAIAFALYYVLSFASPLAGLAVAVIFAFTAVSLVSMLNQFIRVSYFTLTYLYAVESLEQGKDSPIEIAIPASLKNALGFH